MRDVTLTNFRCFREVQTARLAPLTLLVGDNGVGKTSFLALIRVLWDMAYRSRFPDFKKPPYDLGSFDETVHRGAATSAPATEFTAGFSAMEYGPDTAQSPAVRRFTATFRQDAFVPAPSTWRISHDDVWAEASAQEDGSFALTIGSGDRRWRIEEAHGSSPMRGTWIRGWESRPHEIPSLALATRYLEAECLSPASRDNDPVGQEDLDAFAKLAESFTPPSAAAFASSPSRSRPRRTYDPSHAMRDPEGRHVPMLLATMARRDPPAWESLRESLERFGRSSGLFDVIDVRLLGPDDGDPFQLRIRPGVGPRRPLRNLADAGYGVSQALPIVAELTRPDSPSVPSRPGVFLLQHPEVHLHPTAQAALGSLFCEAAADGPGQMIVETHSDHLVDRVRMDVRDGRTGLTPDDVSILYFECGDHAATIHPLGWDGNGNLIAKRGEIPSGYRQFFRTEMRRSLGL